MTLDRRQWLTSILGASLASTILPAGCSEKKVAKRPRFDGELKGPSMHAGHALRLERAAPQNAPARGTHDVVIVGGGVAGLAAARGLMAEGIRDFVVLELENEVGGTSIGGASNGMPCPWGAHYLPVPSPNDGDLQQVLVEMGVMRGVTSDGRGAYDEARLVREPDERLYYRGYWYQGLYPGAGQTAAERAERERFDAQMVAFARKLTDGKLAFTIPVDKSGVDDDARTLDRMSATQWMDAQGYRSSRLRWFCDYACRDDFGLTLSQTSAWAFIHYYAARIHATHTTESADILTWPEGNFALVKHLRNRIDASRIYARALATHIVDDGDYVTVHARETGSDQAFALRARRVVLATPRFIARRLLPQLPAFAHAPHGGWIVANLTLTDRPNSPGFPMAWDNVLYDSPSLGYVVSTHATGRDHGPTVWTYYLPLTDEDPRVARTKLEQHTLEHWQDAVFADLSRAHRGLEQVVQRIDVWRWGHAMVQPRVGAMFSGDRVAAQAPVGRVHFAHSDLSGIALFEEAFYQGMRASREAVAALRGT